MLGFSIMGTPSGFEILNAGISEGLLQASRVDLDNSLLNVFPDADVVMAYREYTNGSTYSCHVYYRFATEIATTRSGSFYGSVILLKDTIADATAIWRALVDLADIVKKNCLTSENKFHRDIKTLSFDTPESVKQLGLDLKSSEPYTIISQKSGFLFIGEEISTYSRFFEVFHNESSLRIFQKLYGSCAAQVLKDVEEKGRLSILKISQLRLEEEYKKRLEEEENKRRIEQENKRKAEDEIRRGFELENERKRNEESLVIATRSQLANPNELQDLIRSINLVTNHNKRLQQENERLRSKLTKQNQDRFAAIVFWVKNNMIWLGVAFIVILVLIFVFWYLFGSPSSETPPITRSDNITLASKPTDSAESPQKELTGLIVYEYDGGDPDIKTINGLVNTVTKQCANPKSAKADFLKSLPTLNPNIKTDKNDLSRTAIQSTRVQFELSQDCKVSSEHFRPSNARRQ